MIFLAYIYSEQALYALWREVRIRCVDTESGDSSSWAFNQVIRNRAIDTTAAEQQQAHFWPEHRGMRWSKKIPYTELDWSNFLHYGTVLD